MPIQEKDLGKYKRKAIYIEEIDNSIVETPAQNILVNLVPGFSKKGPVNRPVFVDNKSDFERIFGEVDRQLENKGSFFHRTVNKMLETGPVWALNLLKTVPNRDTLNYVDISTSANYSNSDFSNPNIADYDRFFNRQDFWERDSESFLDVVNDPTPDTKRLLHLTNMGDKTITTFMFKSDITGFDMSASDWYGGDTKVPTYIHPKSLISDYMVTVLIISGDWTDYKTLSNDSTWSKYFTTSGLITTLVQDFVNEYGVTTLGSFDVSLIPNFKDLNSNDMYIENIINNNTDKTGLFCTYNQELLQDNDYLSDLVDLVGNTIVGTDVNTINFLSYNQSIKEEKSYSLVNLDSANNVFGTTTFNTRTNNWNNWTTSSGIVWNNDFNPSTLYLSFGTGTYIINGVQYTLTNGSVQISTLPSGYRRLDVLYLDTEGLHVMTGTETLSGNTAPKKEITFTNNNSIILGTLEVLTNSLGVYSVVTYNGITVDGSGFIAPTITASSVTGTIEGNYVKLEFLNTTGSTIRNNEYARLRLYKIFNEIAVQLSVNKGVIINTSGTTKVEIIDPTSTWGNTINAEIHIYVETPSNYISSGNILIYYVDKEFVISSSTSEIKTTYVSPFTNVVAKYSNFYLDFLNGQISNGDYILVGGTTKVYVKMYIDIDGILTVKFVDSDLSSPVTIDGSLGISIWSDLGNWKQTIELEQLSEITDDTNTISIKVNMERYSEIIRGMYLEAYYDEDYYSSPSGSGYVLGDTVPRKLTRIINIKNDPSNPLYKILYTDAPIKINYFDSGKTEAYTTSYPAVYNYVTNLKGMSLKPFKIHQDSIPNGTETRQSDILNIMGMNTPLFNGLINKNKITWRYLVDSFGLGLTQQSKQQYIDICGKKLNCIGFINMPSAKQFKKSSNPSFVNSDGSLSTTYIKEGANQQKNPDFLYTFGTGQGRSTVGYFFPYVKITENNETRFVPPSANVATAYMRKHITSAGGVYEWTIVAGVNMGRIPDISGTEMDFTDGDLDNFADMGCNPITFIRNVGYIINDESTAQVFPISSLSYLHSREVLIELENELYDMLLRYQWKFNTPNIRSEIKYRADRICQRYVESDALYTFRNVCDTTNNTNYIIDLQGGVLDTFIEITKGMGWIVNNITIEKTGTINSTGFQG